MPSPVVFTKWPSRHWEDDLPMGKSQTAIGTLVECHTRYVMLFPLPDGTALVYTEPLH
ncbi:MAG: hypothetical protein IH818_12725 [Acidobacteria bacterium]|nr:hypothetical protein [Acidobacteriota bacterium]